MPYRFSFDLTSVWGDLIKEVMKLAYEKNVHERVGLKIRSLARRLRLSELIGIDVSEAVMLIEDLVEVYARNIIDEERFKSSRARALFLPHCARKYMDARCQALFDEELSSYRCRHCSPDCLINQATLLGERMGCDVYVVPGGSCIPKILKRGKYEAVVGVACGQELRMAIRYLDSAGLCGQAVPLVRNGCAHTKFSIESLKRVLESGGPRPHDSEMGCRVSS